MPFQFKKSETPEKAVRRVCREHLGRARARLRHPDHPAAIHGVRKEIKKLRSVLRLIREEIGRTIYCKSIKSLRQAASQFAASRDARVMCQAFRELSAGRAGQFPRIGAALANHARREARHFRRGNSAMLAKRLLLKTDRRVEDLKIKAVGWAAIESGLRESYRRGRAVQERVQRQPLPEYFHRWRKHVKDLWYYFRLLKPAWPAEVRSLMDELDRLGEHLGDDHDLTLLQEFIAAHLSASDGESEELNRLILARQKELRSAALALGDRVYAESPTALCRRLKTHWKHWRK